MESIYLIAHLAYTRLTDRRRDEHGAGAVEWLLIVTAVVAMAMFAGDSVFTYLRSLVGKLG